jgi:hypothetical protein
MILLHSKASISTSCCALRFAARCVASSSPDLGASFHGDKTVIDLIPWLDGACHHDAFAKRDVHQHLADPASGERRGSVQIILRWSHRRN